MLPFEDFVARHGEIVAQAVLENLERFEGVTISRVMSLAERWKLLMQRGEDPVTKS